MKNDLDKAFREKLAHGSAPYPDNLWSKIEAQLPAEKKPPSTLFGKFGIISLFMFLGMAMLIYFTKNTEKLTKLEAHTNTEEHISETELLDKDLSDGLINTQETSVTNTQAEFGSLEEHQNTQSLESKITQGKRSTLTSTGFNKEQIVTKELIDYAQQNAMSSATDGLFNKNFTDASNNIEAESKTTTSSYREGTNSTINSESSRGLEVQLDNVIGVNVGRQAISDFQATNDSQIGNKNPNQNTGLNIHRLSSRKIESVSYLKSNRRRRYNAKKLLTDCQAFVVTGGRGIIVDAYFSPDFAKREFNPRDIEFNAYSSERTNSENAFLSYSVGMRVSYVNNSGLALRSGINFTQINENFKYLNTNITGIDTIITIDSGSSMRDTSYVEIGETVEISTHNRYRSLDVPLLVGLEMPFNSKVKLSLNAGVFVNLLFQQRGRYIDQEGHPNWFVDQNVYKTSLALSYYGSLGVNFYLNPRMDIMIEPNLRYYSQSFTVNEYPLTQEYLKFGVLSGIRYHF